MFDIDSGKLLIVAVIALIVIGPKELPRVLRQVGQAVGKMRRMATEFQGQFMDAMKEADLADIRKELNDLNTNAALDYNFDPVRDIQSELTGSMTPTANITTETTVASPGKDFNLPPVQPPAERELTLLAEGVAPLADPEPASALHAMNGAASPFANEIGPKRRIRVKRRRSSFNLVRDEKAAWSTGEPLVIRQRLVRVKVSANFDPLES